MARFQLMDSKNQLLTFTMNMDWLNAVGGNWSPDALGYVFAQADKEANTWEGYQDSSTWTMYAYLYAHTSDGRIIRVMRLDGLGTYHLGCVLSAFWNDSGTGFLYPEGQSVLVAGALTWK